ncbi:MAG: hypothetical protein ABL966_12150 [Acidimicrobiales bacterium]
MTGPTTRRVAVATTLLVLALGLGACGGDDDPSTATTIDPASITTTTASTPEAGALPPAGALDLEPIYGAALAELGLQLTDRGGLIDRSGGGYEPSATGRHLALYVEPVDERTTPEYIDGIRDVAVVFGDVFERWPGLESYDVCQEPEDDGGTTEPLPVTQIELTAQQAAAFDWDTVSVTDLVQASLAQPPGITLRVGSALAKDPAYRALLEEAS